MKPISFTIPVCPMSLQNSGRRVMVRNGTPIFYKQKKAKDWEKLIEYTANPHKPARPYEGPISMRVEFVLKRPIALNRKKFNPGRIPCPKRPDADNMQKCLQDSLKGFWLDDAQIVELHLIKVYASKTETPKIEVSIHPYNPTPNDTKSI